MHDALTLQAKDFEEAFGGSFDEALKERVAKYNFRYIPLSGAQYNSWLGRIKEVLQEDSIVRAGEHRIDQWERGWGENLHLLQERKDSSALIPRYFGKHKALRWRGNLIEPLSDQFEYHTVEILEEYVFKKYFKDVNSIYEFGCGTGHNLIRAHIANPHAKLYGLEWVASSQKIIELAVELGVLPPATGRKFDFFNPDPALVLDPQSGVYTVAALEQIGDKFTHFIEYLIAQKPKICLHLEPIAELLDPANELDALSIAYFKKRNYLNGFLMHLRTLEESGKIKIHEAARSHTGSLFVEGHSIVAWSPL